VKSWAGEIDPGRKALALRAAKREVEQRE